MDDFFTLKATTVPLESRKYFNQKNEILTWRKTLLEKVKN